MTTAIQDPMIEALAASGPHPDHAEELMLFGQFVGAWDIDDVRFHADGTRYGEGRGEWLFGWALEGRAIQDVLTGPTREERRRTGAPPVEYGTTVRFYDPPTGTWRVTWIAPVGREVFALVGRAEGDRIVIEGAGPHGTLEEWSFDDITDDAFLWRSRVSHDGGATWFTDQEMRATRRG